MLFAEDDPSVLVMGIRDMKARGAPPANIRSNLVANFWLSNLSGVPMRDTQCGLRRYPVARTLDLDVKSRGYAYESEILLRGIAGGMRVHEVPIEVLYPPEKDRLTHFRDVRGRDGDHAGHHLHLPRTEGARPHRDRAQEAEATVKRRDALSAMASLAIATLTVASAQRVAAADAAPPADVHGVLARIATARDGLKTWRAGFTQERTIGLLSTKIRSHGTAILVRPDKLRWQLDAPDAATYWVTPSGVALRERRRSRQRAGERAPRDRRDDGSQPRCSAATSRGWAIATTCRRRRRRRRSP